ncbi:LAME_0F10176g1_1 [Lachancea meyersii CBS 8951]|uniref:LAME_0F10176g1_1 n=1 Tax=Lachancea meyersii CBS 8951 TaxID=1266667 RepID=A0A1G4JVJ6_9SACH|nr:LAME_0F10176g1_1 [Lachancea meyersii CBS 8951]
MEPQKTGTSPSKNHLSQWWKQIRNNPKSMSSDSLSVSGETIHLRPLLMGHSRSFNNGRRTGSPPPSNPQSDEYRSYRDSFLTSRNQFMGHIFGVPLSQSLSVASAEVIVQSELESFGRIPILVAKCGAFLKANALQTSGIFRIAGNNKRVKELQYIFSTPPSYGTKLSDWDGFTVHDAASVLRRFLNNLEEPLVPLEIYERFRKPLQDRPRIPKHLAQGTVRDDQQEVAPTPVPVDSQGEEKQKMKAVRHKKRLTRDIRAALKEYESLFGALSSDARQLLIYLLDLLSLFAQQADENLMTARNLAAVFQPSIISHPQHDMDPKEYELSRIVVEFLIEYSYKLLPHLLKHCSATPKLTAKRTTDTSARELHQAPNLSVPQTNISPEPESRTEEHDGLISPTTPTEQRTQNLDCHPPELNPPSPSFLGKAKAIPKGRPHSKSLSYTLNPSDIISGRRNSRRSWLNRVLSNDTAEFTGTEEECEEEEDDDLHSPLSNQSGSVPKQNFLTLPRPRTPRTMSGNSSTSGGMRPLSAVMNISMEEIAASVGIRRNSNTHTDNSALCTDEESDSRARSRSVRRNSWFQRLRSRSRSAKNERDV